VGPHNAVERFTFRVGAAFLTQSKPWQLAPGEPIMLGNPSNFDSASIPLQPGATHRWLIEVPPEAIAGGPIVMLNGRSSTGHQLVVRLALLEGPPGVPGVKLQTELSGTTADSLNTTFTARMNGGVFVVGTVTNVERSRSQSSPNAVAYQMGLTIQDACVRDCTEHFKAFWRQQDCCQGNSECLAVLDDLTTKSLCEYVYCKADQQPFISTDPDWGGKICNAGGVSRDTPSGLVPMREWAQFVCSDFLR
jgi:hypothetical protein